MRRIYTVDSNFLRREELRELAHEPQEHLFIVPDLVMFEAIKPARRELTLRQSLRILSEIPDRVFLGSSVSELLQLELGGRRALQGFSAYLEATPVMQRILEAVRDEATNEVLDEILQDPSGHITKLIDDHLNHEKNRAAAHQFQYAGLEGIFSLEFKSRLRRDDVGAEELAIVAQHTAVQGCFDSLRNFHDFSDEEALNMVNSHGVVLRYHYVKVWFSLNLSIRDQLKTRSAEQISNDGIDIHNAIIASEFGNFLTRDELAAGAASFAHRAATTGVQYRIASPGEQWFISPI